jgi:hypothetical protein
MSCSLSLALKPICFFLEANNQQNMVKLFYVCIHLSALCLVLGRMG